MKTLNRGRAAPRRGNLIIAYLIANTLGLLPIRLSVKNNLKWSTPAISEKMIVCPFPALILEEKCSSKKLGENCFLKCGQGVILGSKYITCSEERIWNQHFPDCMYPTIKKSSG
ncbi:hypothetical protein TNCV_675591 [Trichonephila clavipes]|nr:hypothetical protein TNCV_675591 [Trichonephila clavipes]